MSAVIQIKDLCKTYQSDWRKPKKQALKGVTLSINEGETFGFIGPNGAGKSTLIKILIGALCATNGSAKLFGRDVSDPEARRSLGFVPENPSLQDYLTPYEVLLMGLRLHGTKVSNERKHCMQWLERFDLDEVADSPLRGFSKGMMQRTALAHAMVIKPRLVILDEPLSGLDPIGRKDVVDILADYRAQGGTIFLTSHVLHDVERLADHFGLIDHGELLLIRSPRELFVDQADRFVVRYSSDYEIVSGEVIRSGLYLIEVGSNELANTILNIQNGQGLIQDVQPKVTLETVFFRTINQ